MENIIEQTKKIIERVKQIVLKPRETWETINQEQTTIPILLKEYLLILAAVPALASFLGMWDNLGLGRSLINAIVVYILSIVNVVVLGRIISLVAPNFGSIRDEVKGFQVALYSYTPVLAAGVLNLIPPLSILILFVGIYGLYILYIGLPIVMATPQEKSLPYIVVVGIAFILISIILDWMVSISLSVLTPS